MQIVKHPGEILLEDFLKPHGITTQDIAKFCCVDLKTIERYLLCKCSTTHYLDTMLCKAFAKNNGYFLKLQKEYDDFIYKEIEPFFKAVEQKMQQYKFTKRELIKAFFNYYG
jgi:addiction module HigA family antidote